MYSYFPDATTPEPSVDSGGQMTGFQTAVLSFDVDAVHGV